MDEKRKMSISFHGRFPHTDVTFCRVCSSFCLKIRAVLFTHSLFAAASEIGMMRNGPAEGLIRQAMLSAVSPLVTTCASQLKLAAAACRFVCHAGFLPIPFRFIDPVKNKPLRTRDPALRPSFGP